MNQARCMVYSIDDMSVTYNRTKTFKMAFNSPVNARHIHSNMNHVKPNLRLQLHNHKVNLNTLLPQETSGTIMMIPHATIVIDKWSEKQRLYQKDLTQQLANCYNLEEIPLSQFLRISSKNVGAVLVNETEYEDIHRIVLSCHVFYDYNCIDKYRSILNTAYKLPSNDMLDR